MTSTDKVKDFTAFEEQPYKGMINPEMFNDVGDDGSGFPGLQRAVYNRMTWWLHSGNMDSGLHVAGHDITGVDLLYVGDIKGDNDDNSYVSGYDKIDGRTGVFTHVSGHSDIIVDVDIDFGGSYSIKDASEITGADAKITNLAVSTSTLLPIGTILMYNGTALGGTLATRTNQIGDEAGDTISMPGWYVCNGLSGTPNLTGAFIRGTSTFAGRGDVGGEDTHQLSTSELPAHTHGSAGSHNHSSPRTTTTDGDHKHSTDATYGVGGTRGMELGTDEGTVYTNITGDHSHDLSIPSDGSHTHTSVGSNSAHENRPVYYSLIYITRVS